ncbi:MAG: TIGR03364 family FAD-dependent oxidoreductase [Saprospiraceae bacterium]
MSKTAIVVGAGITGLATAYKLILQGYQVTILEKSSRADGASIRNFGMIWPIGQASGDHYQLALESKKIWIDLSHKAAFDLNPNGSLHLAYHKDEKSVLREFVETHRDHRPVVWLNPNDLAQKHPSVNHHGLKGGMYSADEMLVDPVEAIQKISFWLQNTGQCVFHFNTPVVAIEGNICTSPGKKHQADQIFVCTGRDIDLLFPEILKTQGVLCELQMMRTDTQPEFFSMGPSMCGGLTLIHYPAFKNLETLSELQIRLLSEYPHLIANGIHVMAAQNHHGEIVIGDTHHYAPHFMPFIDQRLNKYILEYLKQFCVLPDYTIKNYWKGQYYKSTGDHPYFISRVSPHCVLINAFGGNGMTLSFGVISTLLESII